MFKYIMGIATGYLFYTKSGRELIENAGNYVKDSITKSIKDLNKSFKSDTNKIENKNNKIEAKGEENERTNRIIQTDE